LVREIWRKREDWKASRERGGICNEESLKERTERKRGIVLRRKGKKYRGRVLSVQHPVRNPWVSPKILTQFMSSRRGKKTIKGNQKTWGKRECDRGGGR